MNIKKNIHKLLFPNYFKLVEQEVTEKIYLTQEIQILSSKLEDLSDLSKVYEKNKEFFEGLLVKDFVGYIPKDIQEPTLKIFEDHGEMFQRWVLWQSYYVNRKSLHDPLHLPKYDGMMIYLKVLFLMAESNKKIITPNKPLINSEPEVPWIDQTLADVEAFKEHYGSKQGNETDKSKTNKGNNPKVDRKKSASSKSVS